MKIAILDLNAGEPNEGMRCIRELVEKFKAEAPLTITSEEFDVRTKGEIADSSYDLYISSGGPGSPLASEGSEWESNYFGLMNEIIKYNRNNPFQRKHVLLICHSFQVFCRHYNYAKVTKRKSSALGVMPVHKTKEGQREVLLAGLPDPFYAVDSRDYQIVEPDEWKIKSGGGQIVCIEKDRPFISLERAVMAIRFDEAFFGVQFHPEADPDGTYRYLLREDKKKYITEKHGEKKYLQMVQFLNDPEKIKPTYDRIVPTFLKQALAIRRQVVL